jgi:hypothetical protein
MRKAARGKTQLDDFSVGKDRTQTRHEGIVD